MNPITFTILGEPASKSNSGRSVTIGGKSRHIKSKKALSFVAQALPQIPLSARLEIDCDVSITMHIYYATRRPDLDNGLVRDAIQTQWKGQGEFRYRTQTGVILNDRQIKHEENFWHLDPKNPRVEITVRPLNPLQALIPLSAPASTRKRKENSSIRAASMAIMPADGRPF